MAVEIHFLGALLFVGKDDRLHKVLIPNGEVDPDWTKPNPGKHPDKYTATPHFCGIGIASADPREEARFRSLYGTEVTIHDGGSAPLLPAERDRLPNLTNLQLRKPGNSVASAVLVGSAESVEPSGQGADQAYTFGVQSDLILGLKLTYPVDEMEISVVAGEESSRIHIRSGQYVAIYNYDRRYPSKDELEHRGPPRCENGLAIDHDFKWIYSLFGTNAPYKVPQAECSRIGTLMPFVSSCFSAYWDGTD